MSQSALRRHDVLELSKLYEAEFNQPDLHDRILVFDVVASLSLGDAKADDEKSQENEKRAIMMTEKALQMKLEAKMEPGGTVQNETNSENISKYENGDQENVINTLPEIEKVESNPDEMACEMSDENESEFTSQEESKITEDDEGSSMSGDKNIENTAIYESSDHPESENPSNTQNGNFMETPSEDHTDRAFNPSSEKFIRQHKFYIHSSWLALSSSYFRSLLFNGMKESNSTEVHIQSTVSEERHHLMLLEAMYKIDILDKASVWELLNVLKLSDKYDVKFVFKKSKYCLQAAVNSLPTCKQIMKFIKVVNNITDVEDLTSTLQSFLAKEFSPLDKTWQTTSFKELSEPSVRYLLSSNELIAHSENTVFHALVFWIQQTGIDKVLNCQKLPSLLSVVRFELIPIDYLYNIVQHDSVAKMFPDFNELYLRGISYHALPSDILQTLPSQSPRKTPDSQNMVPYTWVIQELKLYNLSGTKRELTSREFFYCGYEMILTINDVKKADKKYLGNCTAAVSATLSLEIVNLKEHSAVTISWTPQSDAINFSQPQTHTFKYDDYISSLSTTIKMFEIGKTQQGKARNISFGASIPTKTTGFSFGAGSIHSTSLSIAMNML